MMTIARLLKDGIELSFADGARGLIPYSDLPKIRERTALSTLSLSNPYEMVLETTRSETLKIPWDFARHYCDASYRPAVEAMAMRGRHALGQRIRRLRNAAGLSQDALAREASIGRVTLVRLEKGKQTPRYKTLGAIARALGVGVSELLVESEFLRQKMLREGREWGAALSGQVWDWVDCSGAVAVGRRAGAKIFPYASAQGSPRLVSAWEALAVNPMAREGNALEHGDVLESTVHFVMHDGDVEEAGVATM